MAWAFCEVDDVLDHFEAAESPSGDDMDALEGFISNRAAEIRQVLADRGLTAATTWGMSYPDAWQLMSQANAIGAAADLQGRFSLNGGGALADEAQRNRAEYIRLLGKIENMAIPGLTDEAAGRGGVVSSYATNNTSDTTTARLIARSTKF